MIFLLLWACTAALARTLEGTWWSPGSFLALALGVNAFGTVVFAPEYYMSLHANLYLQCLVLVVSVAAMLGKRLAVRSVTAEARQLFEMRRKGSLLLFGLAASMVSAYYTLVATGISMSDLASPVKLMRAAQRATYERYTEGLTFPIFYNVANALVIAYATTIAIHFAASKRFEWRLTLPILIYFGSNLLITTRAPVLFLILPMVFAAVYAAKLTSANVSYVPLRNRKVVVIALLVASGIAGVFFLFQTLRFGEQSGRSASEVWAHLRRYPWGSLPGFSLWFDGPGNANADTVAGYYTFMGVYDNLGIATRQDLTYADFVSLARGEPANVYTVFRGLFHDFGALGSGIFLALVGLVGGFVAWSSRPNAYIRMSIYVGIMTFMACAFVVSSWAYTSNIAAMVALPFVVRYFSRPMIGKSPALVARRKSNV